MHLDQTLLGVAASPCSSAISTLLAKIGNESSQLLVQISILTENTTCLQSLTGAFGQMNNYNSKSPGDHSFAHGCTLRSLASETGTVNHAWQEVTHTFWHTVSDEWVDSRSPKDFMEFPNTKILTPYFDGHPCLATMPIPASTKSKALSSSSSPSRLEACH